MLLGNGSDLLVKDEGYEVDTAFDAEDALKKFDRGKYDLILLDMKFYIKYFLFWYFKTVNFNTVSI